MKYIIRHNFRDIYFENGLTYYVTNFFKKFYESLQNKYPYHTFEINNNLRYESFGNGGIYSCMSLSIVNPINDNYILISFWDDWKYHFYKNGGWNPEKMIKFYYCGSFNFVDYFNFKKKHIQNLDVAFPENIQNVYNSFFYGPYFDSHYDELDKIYHNRQKKSSFIDHIQFRGFMWDHRKNMTNKLPIEYFTILDKNSNNQSIGYFSFLEELANYKCSLSLPGNTNICNRDIECFAIGVPVLRPLLDNIISDPLWPDYHYLSFYHAPKYWDGNCWYYSYSDFQDHLIDYWNKIKNNNELLNFISKNAYEWYKKNSSADQNIKYILSQLSLEII